MLARILAIALLLVQPLAAMVVEARQFGAGGESEVCCCCLVTQGRVVECRTVTCPPEQRQSSCCRVDIAAGWGGRAGVAEAREDSAPDRSVPGRGVAFKAMPGVSRPCVDGEAAGGPARPAICVWVI